MKRDWTLFVPHVAQFGIVIFHDTMWDLLKEPGTGPKDMGVPRFIEELRRDGYPVITISKCCGITLVQPVKGGIPLTRQTDGTISA